MYRNILLNILVLSSYFSFSQTENFNLAFTYKVKAKFYEDRVEENADENMILLVNNKSSLYISPYRYKIDSARNEIKSREGSVYELIDFRSQFPRYQIKSSIFKDLKSGNLQHDRQRVNVIFRSEEKIPDFNWQLKNKFKTLLEYKCQLAILDYKGRSYEAWFTSEIPIQNGPWKFGGLPGLILKIEDATREFSFELIAISKDTYSYAFNGMKTILINQNNYIKSVKNYENEFLSQIQDGPSKNNLRKKIFRKIKRLELKNKIEIE